MERVDEKLAEWRAINKQADEVWAKFRESAERSDLDQMQLYCAEAKRLRLESIRAYEQVQAALADRIDRHRGD